MAYIVAPSAKADLDALWHRIYTESGSIDRADGFIDNMKERFETLAAFPRLGPARPEFGKERRSFPVGDYVIIYRIEGENVIISRVPHGSQEIPALFGF